MESSIDGKIPVTIAIDSRENQMIEQATAHNSKKPTHEDLLK